MWVIMIDPKNLSKFATSVREKYTFYDGDFSFSDPGIDANFASFSNRVGWAHRAVDMMSNKTHIDRFENDTLGFNELFLKYRGHQAFEKIKSDILVAGVSFMAFTGKRIVPFTALEATGTFDWNEDNIDQGVAVFRENTSSNSLNSPDAYMIFRQNETIAFEGGDKDGVIVMNQTGRPLMTLLTHKSSTRRPFGHSVITQAVRDSIVGASRTTKQSEIASHYYNTKVRAILGVDPETDVNKLETRTGDMLMIGTNENGNVPSIGEFSQHALAPFKDQISIFAQNFCSETKLTMSDLGIATNAPQSPESLKIAKDDFMDEVHEWQTEIGNQLKYFMTTIYMFENNISQIDDNLRAKIDAINLVWMPIYRDDVSKFGDGLQKSAAVAPAIAKARSLYANAGFTSSEIDEIVASAKENLAGRAEY